MTFFLDANICLDLLDTKRHDADASIAWYMLHKDDTESHFFFSADFISTFYYILTEKKKLAPEKVLGAIDALSTEILPFYLVHSDFVLAKASFFDGIFHDFEDLMILESAHRAGSDVFVTNDKALLALGQYKSLRIVPTRNHDASQKSAGSII